MENKHEGLTRGFSHTGGAWYAKSALDKMPYLDSINIGFYGDGTTGEFGVYWYKNLGAKLEAFEDAWDALFYFKDLIDEMKKYDSKNITPLEFCELLKRLGIEDLTKYNQE